MKKAKLEFTITGFVIALILVGMFAFGIGYFVTELQTEYSLGGNSTIGDYQNYEQLKINIDKMNNASDIEDKTGVLDVIGSYFKTGYTALVISKDSTKMFSSLLNKASEDIPEFSFFRDFIYLIILIALILGIIITVMVKMRI